MTAVRMPTALTVDEFLDWQPPRHRERRWQLVDGEPVAMAPASEAHGRILAEAAYLLTAHLRATRPSCAVLVAPGLVPKLRATTNMRIPDLAVTCAPPSGGREVVDPLLLLEILSPSNESATRANVWAYATVPSVAEILLLRSTRIEAELLRRRPDGHWPDQPTAVPADGVLHLDSLGLILPLRDFYRTTGF